MTLLSVPLKRFCLHGLSTGVLCTLVSLWSLGPAEAQVSSDALDLHKDSLVLDAHIHMMTRHLLHGTDFGQRLADGQVDLPRAIEGGLDAMFFSLYVPEEYYPGRYETKHALRELALALDQIEKNKGVVEVALTADDVERISRQGKIAAVLDLEGGFDLDGDLYVLRAMYRLGLRVAQLPAHNWANNFADSCCAEAKWNGLNEQGRRVVREMNRLGIVINVSHGSDATIEQVLGLSSDPIMATHHGFRSRNNIPRLLPDDLARKIAAKDGVIGLQIGNEFHNRKFYEWRYGSRPHWDPSQYAVPVNVGQPLTIEEIDNALRGRFPMLGSDAPDEMRMTVEEWVDVMDAAVRLVGEDHVAIGSDFDGGPTPPRGMRDIRDLPMITDAMLRKGYSPERIRKLLGGNVLRVLRVVTQRKKRR